MVYIFEYIWLDGFNSIKSKTKIIYDLADNLTYYDFTKKLCLYVPKWNYDGSSTGQATTQKSDVILKPVNIFPDPFRKNSKSYLILCESYDSDDKPLKDNYRSIIYDKSNIINDFSELLFGIEQEYVIYDKNNSMPYGWLSINNPCSGLVTPDNCPYYCGVGGNHVFNRNFVEEHMEHCLYANIKICGINAEVMASQWEFQVGPLTPLDVCDHLIIARYILERLSEKYNCYINYDPKPIDSWNGSGCHTNFSNKKMREEGGYNEIYNVCEKLSKTHAKHIKNYGNDNEKRLTGKYETSDINNFSYGEANRATSVRIPINVVKERKGYIEDRRPAANMNPYLVINEFLNTLYN